MGYSQVDFYTGASVDSEDINGVVNTTLYNDALDRPTQTIAANNLTAFRRQSTIAYDDANRKITATGDLYWFGDNFSKSESYYDGLGRTIETRKFENGNGTYIAAQTQYDALGRAYKQSNPFRFSEVNVSNPILWTTSRFDVLGRVKEVETPDGAKVLTSYLGNAVTVADQAGKQRRSITNALGQLKRVDEPNDAGDLGTIDAPVQPTNYLYDALGNLATVNQGIQTRSFVYDSLSRLKSATSPESGAINYSYDANGNLQTKTDARQIATTFVYDNLNRVLSRSYSDNITPAVSYFYDNLSNAKGKLIKVSSTVSTTEYASFDNLGRVLSHKQTTDGTAYTTEYKYNLSGALSEETYPSTRVVKNVLDANGNLEMVQSKKNQTAGFFDYGKNFTYTGAGAVSSMQLGNGRWESTTFNSRLQPTQVALGTLQNGADKLKLNYDYGTTNNNGDVLSQTITVPMAGSAAGFTAAQNYSYDSLNRLKSAQEIINSSQSWKQTFVFDRYGNRNFDTANTTTLGSCPAANQCNPAVDVANNKFTTGQGYSYDLAGNIISDAQGRTFNYDAENKQKSVASSGSSLGTYFYDGDGKRVKKLVGTETTIFVYDAAGKMVAEYTTSAPTTTQVSYLTSDALGTPRINTDANGNVMARHDYMPFGEEIDSTITSVRNVNLNYGDDGIKKKFTAYERDLESSLDFAEARMYNFNYGRFTTSDPLLASGRIEDPQTWNRYAYVLNNPLNYVDPTGLYECEGNKAQCDLLKTRLSEARDNLKKIEDTYKKESKQYEKASKSINAYGAEGEKNGVIIKFDGKERSETTGKFDSKGKLMGNVTVHFKQGDLDAEGYSQSLVAHEGKHVNDYKTVGNRNDFFEEMDGLNVQSLFLEAQSPNEGRPYPIGNPVKDYYIWNPSWKGPDKETLRSNALKDFLAVPEAQGGFYELTPPKPKPQRNPSRRSKN